MADLSQEQLDNFKDILLAKKKTLESQLDTYAKKNDDIDNDYKTIFEQIGDRPDENADEVTLYEERLAIEHELEGDLEDINAALDRIDNGTYGICTNCNKPISIERLKAMPEATVCIKCE